MRERSAGAIVFRLERRAPRYLLLNYSYKTVYWDFPKGNIERGEEPLRTALRELKEETGITKVEVLPGFKEDIKYIYMRGGKRVFKEVIFFLLHTAEERVTLSEEHIGYAWLPFEKAMRTLTFRNSRQVLEKAHAFLEKTRSKPT